MRPHQWVKNLFVLTPLVFALELTEPVMALRALLATLVFCIAASAVYMANDIVDVNADRDHPTKSLRPIASGAMSLRAARIATLVLALIALLTAMAIGWRFAALTLLYLLLSLSYSSFLKRIAYADVLSIAAGFELRVLAGGAAARVPVSAYLCTLTVLLSLYLGLGKRLHELLRGGTETQRHALRDYRAPHLRQAMAVTGIGTFVVYLVYCFDPRIQAQLGTSAFALTSGFALWGLYRFYQLVQRLGSSESPTDRMLRDRPFLLNIALWGASVLLVLYGPF